MADPYVIIGAGIAGGSAAMTLRAEGHAGPIVLVGAEPEQPYWRPPLSKAVLRGHMAIEDARLQSPAAWCEQDIELHTGRVATALDPTIRTVTLDDGDEVRYDRLLLATGGRPRPLPDDLCPEPGSRVHLLRTARDAAAVRERLAGSSSLLVIGAGLIGLEVAATARSLGCEVTVLEAAGLPLGRVTPPMLGRIFADLHRSQGVRLRLGVQLDRLEETRDAVIAHERDGTASAAELAIIAIGMDPEVTLARDGGLTVTDGPGGGIVVDEFCRTSAPHVYAAGDVTAQPHPCLGGHYRIEHCTNAQDQGKAAARNMLGRDARYAPVPLSTSEQYGRSVQTSGWPTAADLYGRRTTAIRGDLESLSFTAVFWRGDRVVGAVSVDHTEESQALHRIIETDPHLDYELLADPNSDLSALHN